ncbi:vegetative cell wall protein gp1-like [Canna indica]|uniref:Vegetative cell wall protein gp1-like n=1 Tax=Canna indica TaxID=4628 RepID=A0AAQ3KX98_9LILI|nr:vegetative cell wall protein gp1-like [Canna indica]
MRSELPLLLAFLAILRPAAAICAPRNPTGFFDRDSTKSPAAAAAGNNNTPSPSRPAPAASTPPPQTPSVPQRPPASIGNHDALAQLCRHTDYADICVSSMEPFLAGAGAVDPAKLLILEMKAMRVKVQEALTKAGALANKPGMDSRSASYLQVCSDVYDDALDSLDAAEKALQVKDKGTLDSMLSGLITDFVTCEDGFDEADLASPMEADDGLLKKLGSNCLAFAELV